MYSNNHLNEKKCKQIIYQPYYKYYIVLYRVTRRIVLLFILNQLLFEKLKTASLQRNTPAVDTQRSNSRDVSRFRPNRIPTRIDQDSGVQGLDHLDHNNYHKNQSFFF